MEKKIEEIKIPPELLEKKKVLKYGVDNFEMSEENLKKIRDRAFSILVNNNCDPNNEKFIHWTKHIRLQNEKQLYDMSSYLSKYIEQFMKDIKESQEMEEKMYNDISKFENVDIDRHELATILKCDYDSIKGMKYYIVFDKKIMLIPYD